MPETLIMDFSGIELLAGAVLVMLAVLWVVKKCIKIINHS